MRHYVAKSCYHFITNMLQLQYIHENQGIGLMICVIYKEHLFNLTENSIESYVERLHLPNLRYIFIFIISV